MSISTENHPLKELIDAVLLEQDYFVLTKKFSKEELESVLDFVETERYKLITYKQTLENGDEVESLNFGITTARKQIRKINRAMNEIAFSQDDGKLASNYKSFRFYRMFYDLAKKGLDKEVFRAIKDEAVQLRNEELGIGAISKKGKPSTEQV